MDWGRLKLASRGEPLVIAYRHALSSSERDGILPESEASSELDWLPPEAVARVVDAFASRFPNSRDPEKTRRVMAYVKDRVASGVLAVVRRR